MDAKKPCPECGCTYTTVSNQGCLYCADCHEMLGLDPNWEPGDVDGEAFRGREAQEFEASQQDWIQRNLK